mmetsp:Transcript_163458/g.524136  ORF Transcript_163458/g.524136 Transcript_163458/m.524136 type:complete len:206 (-) Transcript_163458:434-1051(-)
MLRSGLYQLGFCTLASKHCSFGFGSVVARLSSLRVFIVCLVVCTSRGFFVCEILLSLRLSVFCSGFPQLWLLVVNQRHGTPREAHDGEQPSHLLQDAERDRLHDRRSVDDDFQHHDLLGHLQDVDHAEHHVEVLDDRIYDLEVDDHEVHDHEVHDVHCRAAPRGPAELDEPDGRRCRRRCGRGSGGGGHSSLVVRSQRRSGAVHP